MYFSLISVSFVESFDIIPTLPELQGFHWFTSNTGALVLYLVPALCDTFHVNPMLSSNILYDSVTWLRFIVVLWEFVPELLVYLPCWSGLNVPKQMVSEGLELSEILLRVTHEDCPHICMHIKSLTRPFTSVILNWWIGDQIDHKDVECDYLLFRVFRKCFVQFSVIIISAKRENVLKNVLKNKFILYFT